MGNLVRFKLIPGQRSQITGIFELIEGLEFGALLADKAFDANDLRADLANRDATAVIPAKSNRVIDIPHDKEVYKWRHQNWPRLFEQFSAKVKWVSAGFVGLVRNAA